MTITTGCATVTDRLDELSLRAGRALEARGWMLVTAESCTGGGIAECITRTAGSSAWFDRAFITYTNAAKQEMLGVQSTTLARHGAVAEETAREMARGALNASRADIALSVTGIAGPGGAMPGKPVGMVCFAWALRDGSLQSDTQHFAGDRAAVRRASIEHALQGMLQRVAHPDETRGAPR
jgi:nicotinamide-nucleotide amidase